MSEETRVLYNESCPLCRAEIGHYRQVANCAGAPLRFDPLEKAADWGLTEDEAARRLHVLKGRQVLAGFDAFLAIWAALPRWRLVAWIAGSRPLRPVLAFAYDRIAAPLLYRAHLRRRRLGGGEWARFVGVEIAPCPGIDTRLPSPYVSNQSLTGWRDAQAGRHSQVRNPRLRARSRRSPRP